jgi:hypothetical protein
MVIFFSSKSKQNSIPETPAMKYGRFFLIVSLEASSSLCPFLKSFILNIPFRNSVKIALTIDYFIGSSGLIYSPDRCK